MPLASEDSWIRRTLPPSRHRGDQRNPPEAVPSPQHKTEEHDREPKYNTAYSRMKTICAKIDKHIANLATSAKRTVGRHRRNSTKRENTIPTSASEEFRRSIQRHLPLIDDQGLRALTVTDMFQPDGVTVTASEICAVADILILRCHLETALLQLDDCASPLNEKLEWPNHDELKGLLDNVSRHVKIVSKRIPKTPWKKCERIDQYFPRLKLCLRIKNFLNRIGGDVHQRPLSVLMKANSSQAAKLREKFFDTVTEARQGKQDPATVNWLEFSSLLLKHQNSLCSNGKRASPILAPSNRKHSGSPEFIAYVKFLELDRKDLQWIIRYKGHLWKLAFWVEELGNPELMKVFSPFFAGPIDIVDSSLQTFEAEQKWQKRLQNKERKAKSRNKSAKKV